MEEIVDAVVLEQFVTQLQSRTTEWVQCHHHWMRRSSWLRTTWWCFSFILSLLLPIPPRSFSKETEAHSPKGSSPNP